MKIQTTSGTPSNPYLSIEKAFRILEILSAHSPLGVTEIADELGLKKSSVSRLLKALAELGYAEVTAQRGQYRMGPRILVLAKGYLEDDRLVREAQPILHELALTLRASAHLAVLAGDDLVIVAKEPSPEHIQVTTRVGGRTPLHASALGKILLADLPEKKRGRCSATTWPDTPRRPSPILANFRKRSTRFASKVSPSNSKKNIGRGLRRCALRNALAWIAAISVAGPLHGTPFKIDAAHQQLVVEKAAELSRRVTRV